MSNVDPELESIVENLLDEIGVDLVGEEAVSCAIAETNATFWGLDTYEVLSIEREDPETIAFRAVVNLSGDQDPDQPFCGDSLAVTLGGTATLVDNDWELEGYEVEEIENNWYVAYSDDDVPSSDEIPLALDAAEVHRVLRANSVEWLHHANKVATSCSFLALGGLASRGQVLRERLPQVGQYTDTKDQEYGIWDDIFTDGVDIHRRAGHRKGGNLYGPVLFQLPLDCLLHLPSGTEVMVMRTNPANWRPGDALGSRYFLSVKDLEEGYVYGTFSQHVVFRVPGGVLPFPGGCTEVILDNPGQNYPKAEDVYTTVLNRLNAAAVLGGVTLSVRERQCRDNCQCRQKYAEKIISDENF